MKLSRILFILFLSIFIVGCGSIQYSQTKMTSDQLLECPGTKSGFIELENGDVITFKCAHVFIDRKLIRIQSDRVHQTVLWRNVRQIIIYNGCLYDEYRKEMQKLKEIIQQRQLQEQSQQDIERGKDSKKVE